MLQTRTCHERHFTSVRACITGLLEASSSILQLLLCSPLRRNGVRISTNSCGRVIFFMVVLLVNKYLCIAHFSRQVLPFFPLLIKAVLILYCILCMVCSGIQNLSNLFLPKSKILVGHGRLGGKSYRLIQTESIILVIHPFRQQPTKSSHVVNISA